MREKKDSEYYLGIFLFLFSLFVVCFAVATDEWQLALLGMLLIVCLREDVCLREEKK